MTLINDYRNRNAATPTVQPTPIQPAPYQVGEQQQEPVIPAATSVPAVNPEDFATATPASIDELAQPAQVESNVDLVDEESLHRNLVTDNLVDQAYSPSPSLTHFPTLYQGNTNYDKLLGQSSDYISNLLGNALNSQPEINLTPNVSVPADPKASFDSTAKVGQGKNTEDKPLWVRGVEALSWGGNVITGFGADVLNLPGKIDYIRKEVIKRTGDALGVDTGVLEQVTSNPVAGAVGKLNENIQQYANQYRNDNKLTWQDFIPNVNFDAKRNYTVEAVKGQTQFTATENVFDAGEENKSPIAMYNPKFDAKGKANPTWWAGLGVDFVSGFLTGVGVEAPLAKTVGTVAGVVTKSSKAASVATKTAQVVIDPVGELVLSPALQGAAKAVKGVATKLLPQAPKVTMPTSRVLITPPPSDPTQGVIITPPPATVTYNASPSPQVDVVAEKFPKKTIVATEEGVAEVKQTAGGKLVVVNQQGEQKVIAPWEVRRTVTQTPEVELNVAPSVNGAATLPVFSDSTAKVDLLDGTRREVSSPSHVDATTRNVVEDFVNSPKPTFSITSPEALPPTLTKVEGTNVVVKSQTSATLPDVEDIPAVDSRVFEGTMTIKDFSRVLSEQVPGTQVDVKSLGQSKRTLQDLLSLAKKVVAPTTGEPIFSPSVKEIKTYAQLQARVDKLGLPPSMRQLFSQYGFPIPRETLDNAADFRVVFQEEVPFTAPEASVVQRNVRPTDFSSIEMLAGATDVKVEGNIRSYKVQPTAKKTQPTAKAVVGNIDKKLSELRAKADMYRDMGNSKGAAKIQAQIDELEGQLFKPDVTDPDQLAVVQKAVLPVELQGSSDEAVELTQQVLDVDSGLDELDNLARELRTQKEEIELNYETSLSRVEEVADVGRKFTQDELAPVEPQVSLARATARDLGLDVTDDADASDKLMAVYEHVRGANLSVDEAVAKVSKSEYNKTYTLKAIDEAEFNELGINAEVVNKQAKKLGVYVEGDTPNIRYARVSKVLEGALTAEEAKNIRFTDEVEEMLEGTEVFTKLRSLKEEAVTANTEGKWFHGTRVELPKDFDPVLGGSRAEWGTGFYLTRDAKLADSYARGSVNPNQPLSASKQLAQAGAYVHDIAVGGKARYVHTPLKKGEAELFDDVFIRNFGDDDPELLLPLGKLMKRNGTLAEAFGLMERLQAKAGMTEAQMTKMSREVSLGLRKLGVDALYDKHSANVINPAVLKFNGSQRLDLTSETALDVAGHRYNADSVRAARNPKSLSAQVDFEESSVKLQAELLEKVSKELDNVEEQRANAVVKLLESQDALEKAALKDLQEAAEVATRKERVKRDKQMKKLLEDTDPCQP